VSGFVADSEPNPGPVGKVILVERAIAHRVDIGQTGAALPVNLHSIATFGSGGDQWLNRWNDTDSDDDQLGGNNCAVSQPHAGGSPVGSLDAFGGDGKPDVDAVGPMVLLVEARQGLACN